MKVKLKQINNDAHFIGTTAGGQQIEIHAPLKQGTTKAAPSPMEVLLMSAASCTAVDVLLILQKMKQQVDDLAIDVEGDRVELKSAKPYRGINLEYKIKGKVDQKKAERAVGLAVDKYCSVLESLHPDTTVSWTVEIE